MISFQIKLQFQVDVSRSTIGRIKYKLNFQYGPKSLSLRLTDHAKSMRLNFANWFLYNNLASINRIFSDEK